MLDRTKGKTVKKAPARKAKKAADSAIEKAATKKQEVEAISISPLNVKRILVPIVGTSPYLQNAFPNKAKHLMMEKMRAGPQAKKGQQKEARDFDSDFVNAHHVSSEGWVGLPASGFRNACIDVCRMVGYKMTHAKMSIFVGAQGLDQHDGHGLIKLLDGNLKERKNKGHDAEMVKSSTLTKRAEVATKAAGGEFTAMPVRNATGVADIRIRPMWREWGAIIPIEYDADQFKLNDVINLLSRAGRQIGIGEGRPYSKQSNGLGFGTFKIVPGYEIEVVSGED